METRLYVRVLGRNFQIMIRTEKEAAKSGKRRERMDISGIDGEAYYKSVSGILVVIPW